MNLSKKNATILLALIISARATSFLFSKLCLTNMNTFSLIALRFSTAFLILFVIFNKRILKAINKRNILSGIIIGSLYFLVLSAEHTGLKATNASTAAFIENLAIIFVPFLECLISKTFPRKNTLLSASLAIIGVEMLTILGSNSSFSFGEYFLLAAAFFYATAIVVTARLAKRGDAFIIGFFQVTTTGVLSWLTVIIRNDFTAPQIPAQYIMILILAIVCTLFGFTLQPVVQSKLPAETVGLFCALGPLTASVLSCIFLKEQFTLYSFFGAMLILTALVVESAHS